MSVILYLMCQYFDNTYFAEKKWQYCQKNFVEVRIMQIKRNFYFCC